MRGGVKYRERYVPAPRDPVSAGRPASTFNELDPRDVHEIERNAFTVDPANLAGHDDAFRGAIRSAARLEQAPELVRELQAHFGGVIPADIAALFTRELPATGAARTSGEVVRDLWNTAISLPKQAVVGAGPRHMFNIASLLALNDAGALPEAVRTAAKIVAHPEQRFDLLEAGRHLGAIGPSAERAVPAAEWLSRLGLPGRAIGGAMRKMNDATWAFDDAAVQALAKRKAQAGARGYSAGRDARKALVDYDRISRLTKAARAVAPFATFESAIPGAVGKAIARDPRRVEAANRLSGGTLLGGQADVPGVGTVKLNLPPAKVGRFLATGDIADYGRSAAADPVRALASLVLSLNPRVDPRHYFTYGLDPRKPDDARKIITNMAAGGIPEARDVLDQLGAGTFAPRQNLLETILQNWSGVQVR